MSTDRRSGWLLVGAQFALLGVLALAPTGSAWPLPAVARFPAYAAYADSTRRFLPIPIDRRPG